MAEKLATATGSKLDVGAATDTEPDKEWVQHMREAARAADETEHEAPERRDPEAPYGRKPDGTPKKRPGRPSKGATDAAKPRVQKRAKPAGGSEPKDYRQALDELFTGAWGVACLANQADAGAIYVARPALVVNVNAAAQQNAMIARGVEFVTGATAVGMAAGTLLLLGLQIAANHGRVNAKSVAHLGIKSPEELERINLDAMTKAAEEYAAAQADALTE